MKCSKCDAEIKCKFSIKTEESDRPIEYSHQWWYCPNCNAKFYGILEDSHVNMFDDRLEHKGYLVEENKWQGSLAWAIKCPDSGNSSCNCAVHQEMPPAGFYGDSAWDTYE